MQQRPILSLKVSSILTPEMGEVNTVYISTSPQTPPPSTTFMILKNVPFVYTIYQRVEPSKISLNNVQREFLNLELGHLLEPIDFLPRSCAPTLNSINISLSVLNAGKKKVDLTLLTLRFLEVYDGYPFTSSQLFIFLADKLTFKATVTSININNNEDAIQNISTTMKFGTVTASTNIHFMSVSPRLAIISTNASLINNSPLLQPDFSFEDLGIGGLKTEFSTMFRRAFVQRVFNSSLIKKLGIPHVKGILLYGPPGTGKTLIARKIGSLLNAHPPKIVNGPEILNKYVGQSEENIRKLFLDAEIEYKQSGENSLLHIIIFDELDAIFKTRSSSGANNIGDQVVNQLLSKMDGVEALDNILVIGMTNRPDLIDTALKRPGRFEIHIEITLPSMDGRLEIFRIHTKEMCVNKFLGGDVDLVPLARKTRNYTGAEICAVVKCAASYALERKVHSNNEDVEDRGDAGKKESKKRGLFSNITEKISSKHDIKKDSGSINKLVGDEEDIKITMKDFINALDEVKPSFGCDEEMLYEYIQKYVHLKSHKKILDKIEKYADALRVKGNENIECKSNDNSIRINGNTEYKTNENIEYKTNENIEYKTNENSIRIKGNKNIECKPNENIEYRSNENSIRIKGNENIECKPNENSTFIMKDKNIECRSNGNEDIEYRSNENSIRIKGNKNIECRSNENSTIIIKDNLNTKRPENNLKTLSFLLYGESGTGKTTLAIKSALSTSFPFIKIISPINFVGKDESERITHIKNVFEDAYKSEESVVILDDIIALIDYVSIGPRFLNGVLQAIKIYIKNIGYKGNSRVLVLGTSSNPEVLKEMGVLECFSGFEEVPLINVNEYRDAVNGIVDFDCEDGEIMTIKKIVSMIDNRI